MFIQERKAMEKGDEEITVRKRKTFSSEEISDFAKYRLRTGRTLVDERRRTPGEERLATASGLDRLLGGGLERGATVELVGRGSSGRFAVVLSVLAAVTGGGEPAALIDLGDGLDPRVAAAAGVDLERLLWVRPRRMKEALGSAEIALGCGLPLVVLELGLPPLAGGRGNEAAWLRLARTARAQRTALLVSSPYRVSGTAVRTVVELRATRARWHGRGFAPSLVRGLAGRLELAKSRIRATASPVEQLELAHVA